MLSKVTGGIYISIQMAEILWVDDEIEHLKSQIMFLEQKGYNVETCNNGSEALEMIRDKVYDIIFLDEMMPGMSGLEVLGEIKRLLPNLPVVMITKSEEESIMENAIGSKISDYLIKPVNPNQILLSIKKNLENKKLVSEKSTHAYQIEFRNIGMEINNSLSFDEWINVYKKLVHWELEIVETKDSGMMQVLKMQKNEANKVFTRFVEKNYLDWIQGNSFDVPVLSHTLLKKKVLPKLDNSDKLFLLVIDNLRYDQWKAIQPIIEEYYRIENEEIYYSILPSTTQYARNALFSGLMPADIQQKYPKYWKSESAEGTKNQYEPELLGEFLKRFGRDYKYKYHKVLNLNSGRKLIEMLPNLMKYKFNAIVYNFVDMLSHARTDMEIIRELADNEAAYRSLMVSWFKHSSIFDFIRFLARQKVNLLITTDHGSVQVNNAIKIIGDRDTNANLRYKFGRSLNYDNKEAFSIQKPTKGRLPKENVSTTYVFAGNNDFFVYPNKYNYYVNFYKNTFQHGGISMEELLIPFISLKAK